MKLRPEPGTKSSAWVLPIPADTFPLALVVGNVMGCLPEGIGRLAAQAHTLINVVSRLSEQELGRNACD